MLRVVRATTDNLPEAAAVMRTVLEHDLGGYQARWHTDLDDLASAYLDPPGHALFVARVDGRLIGTAAVRACRLRAAHNPPWLVERYTRPGVCELVRVWVAPAGRRRGVARALVADAARWAVIEAGYRTVYFHTDASVPGAEAFWRSMPTVEVHDTRPDPFHCVHFELDVDKLLASPRS